MKSLLFCITAIAAAVLPVSGQLEMTTMTDTQRAGMLRALGVNGWNTTDSEESELWRILAKWNRQVPNAGGPVDFSFRAVTLGDSVSVDITSEMQGHFGYGGQNVPVLAWGRSNATPLYDQWTRSPGGDVIQINSGGYMEYLDLSSLLPTHSVVVYYLRRSDYGSFKVQYQENKTGSWIDCSTVTQVGGGTDAGGGVVSTAVGVTEAWGQASFQLPRADIYNFRVVSTSGTVYIIDTILNMGGFPWRQGTLQSQHSGALTINWAEGGKSLSQHFSQYPDTMLNSMFGFADPHVIIYKSANGYSLANYQTHWPTFAQKVMTAAPNALFVVVGSHTAAHSHLNIDNGDSAVDDYLKAWASNTPGAIFIDLRQSFPRYNRQLTLAGAGGFTGSENAIGHYDFAGNVNGKHSWRRISGGGTSVIETTSADANTWTWRLTYNGTTYYTGNGRNTTTNFPTTPDATWTATNGATGPITLTYRNWLVDDLWSDGIHIYNSTGSPVWGGGASWAEAIVWETIRPVCEIMTNNRPNSNNTHVLPGRFNTIRLFGDTTNMQQKNKLVISPIPRQNAELVFRYPGEDYNGGNQTYSGETGIGMGTGRTLYLKSGGTNMLGFGSNSTFPQIYYGVQVGGHWRPTDGFRVITPTQVYGPKPGAVIEGRQGMATTTRIFGLDREATESAAGNPLWSWYPNGDMEYEGTTNDANETTLRIQEPTVDATVTIPSRNTGTVCVFLGILADPPAGSISTGAIYVDNDGANTNGTGTWLYDGAAWQKLN